MKSVPLAGFGYSSMVPLARYSPLPLEPTLQILGLAWNGVCPDATSQGQQKAHGSRFSSHGPSRVGSLPLHPNPILEIPHTHPLSVDCRESLTELVKNVELICSYRAGFVLQKS